MALLYTAYSHLAIQKRNGSETILFATDYGRRGGRTALSLARLFICMGYVLRTLLLADTNEGTPTHGRAKWAGESRYGRTKAGEEGTVKGNV